MEGAAECRNHVKISRTRWAYRVCTSCSAEQMRSLTTARFSSILSHSAPLLLTRGAPSFGGKADWQRLNMTSNYSNQFVHSR